MLRVAFVERLRGERRYDDVESLVAQMRRRRGRAARLRRVHRLRATLTAAGPLCYFQRP